MAASPSADFSDISHLTHPAVLVTAEGELIAAQGAGAKRFAELGKTMPQWSIHLLENTPFRFFIGGQTCLIGVPAPDGSRYRLEWQAYSHDQIRLALFQAVSKAVNSSLLLEDIFDSLGEVLQQFLPYASGTILILDETQNTIKVIVRLDDSGQAAVSGESNNFTGYDVLIDGLLKSPQSHRLFAPFPDSALTADPTAKEAIIAPLISKGRLIGCIGLSGNAFGEQDLQLLEEVSEQLAIAVENARLYWQTQSQAGREFLINQITKSIRQSLDIQAILETTVQEVGRVMGLSRCLIHYWEAGIPRQFEYTLSGTAHLQDPEGFARFSQELFARRNDSPHRYNPFILNDVRQFQQESDLLAAEGIKSLAVFPILVQEKTFVGTISLHQNDSYRAWLGEEIDLLKAIAEHMAVALHQANLFQEKENQRQQLETTLNELQQMQMQLIQSEKMAVLGQFVAGIAHEVNTPLGTLMSNDDTVRRCLERMTIQDEANIRFHQSALSLLDINRLAGERIREIVRNLRNFARLDESDLKRVDLHEGLESTLLLVDSSLRGKVTLVRHYGDLPLVECFPGLLNQVFMNLIVNSIHSIETQGTITIDTAYQPDDHTVTVRVADTGKGISPEHLSRIFDPGFTTKGVGIGTGLGLAICYKILEKHHGRIAVDSTPGLGTRMTVCVPVNQVGFKQGDG